MVEQDENIIGDELTLKQERFCRYYTQKSELFGNGVLSYAKAYEYDLEGPSRVREKDDKGNDIIGTSEYDGVHAVCRVGASRLLTHDYIIKRITQLLNDQMTDDVVDARLSEIILDGKAVDSIAAIKEYNKLKQRIVEKTDITSGGEKIAGFNFVKNETKTDNADNKTDSETGTGLGPAVV